MAKEIQAFRIRRDLSTHTVRMPRRARITGLKIIAGDTFLDLYAEVESNADTQAFDTGRHERTFAVRKRGDAVPDGALVAYDQGIHVYEVKPQ